MTDTANLCSWIDFNRDEVFAFSERYCTTVAAGATSATLSWTVPQLVVPGLTYARVRLSYDPLTVATGKVSSGEVEDYSMTVVPASVPFALPDTSSGLNSATQNINILANDETASGVTWDVTSVKLCASGQTPNNCNATSVTVAGEGTFTLNPATGVVTFVADANATAGTKTALTYRVTDVTGQTATSTLTPVIPQPPVANPDTNTDNWDTNQTISPLTNDTAGAVSAPLVASTVKLCGISPAQSPNNCSQTTLTRSAQALSGT